MKYKTFFLENKTSGGKMGNRQVKFDPELIGSVSKGKEDQTNRDLQLLETTGYPHETKSIRLVNPEMFAKFKFLTKVDIEEMFTRNNEYWQPVLLNLKQVLANDPYVNQENLTRKTLYSFFNSEGEDLMKDQSQQIPGLPQSAQSAQPVPIQTPTKQII